MKLVVALLAILGFSAVNAGTIGVAWEPVPGAESYRLYYGTSPRGYSQIVDTAGATSYSITVEDCTTYYVAVKAYNQYGESPAYSDELAGWAALRFGAVTGSTFYQGELDTLVIEGANFPPAAEVDFEVLDSEGTPLAYVQGTPMITCNHIEAPVTVAPTARGHRAAQVGVHVFRVRTAEGVIGSGSFEVLFDEERLDINRSDTETRDRVDGKDLVWLAYSHATDEGDPRYNPDADLNGDGSVDGEDLAYLATGFGACWDGTSWSLSFCP